VTWYAWLLGSAEAVLMFLWASGDLGRVIVWYRAQRPKPKPGRRSDGRRFERALATERGKAPRVGSPSAIVQLMMQNLQQQQHPGLSCPPPVMTYGESIAKSRDEIAAMYSIPPLGVGVEWGKAGCERP
jgi:hypothetical protein